MNIVWKEENGPVLIEPKIFKDERGYFYESFSEKEFKEKVADVDFVQDNQSKSSYGVLRGMHFQKPPYTQAKLVRVVNGAVLDVIVDLRKDSPKYGQIYSAYLTDKNHRQFFVPRGFAHGFLTLEDNTIFQYKCDNYYNKESEGGISYHLENFDWDDWMGEDKMIFSDKDKIHPLFKDFVSPF